MEEKIVNMKEKILKFVKSKGFVAIIVALLGMFAGFSVADVNEVLQPFCENFNSAAVE